MSALTPSPLASVILFAAASLVLAGCSSSASDPAASTSPSVSQTKAVSQAPVPRVTPGSVASVLKAGAGTSEGTGESPAVAEISTAGVHPIVIGSHVHDPQNQALMTFDETFCFGAYEGTPEEVGRWVATGPLDSEVSLGVDIDGNILWIDVWSMDLSTEKGIRRDSTKAELLAAYPNIQGPYDNGSISEVWWISDDAGSLVFETQAANMVGFESQHSDQVVSLIRVLGPGIDTEWGSANSGNVADACF